MRRRSRLRGAVSMVVSLVVVLAALIGVGLVYHRLTDHKFGGPWRPYIAAQSGFRVSFPGDPARHTRGWALEHVRLRATVYEGHDARHADYQVVTAAYPPGLAEEDMGARLTDALHWSNRDLGLFERSVERPGRLAGRQTVIATTPTLANAGKPIVREEMLFSGDHMYDLVTKGASEAEFTRFTGSFSLLG